jgi:hypothetical protein
MRAGEVEDIVMQAVDAAVRADLKILHHPWQRNRCPRCAGAAEMLRKVAGDQFPPRRLERRRSPA